MVARTPSRQRKPLASIDPSLLRETLKKVDKCMATLQELQSTVTKGREKDNALRPKQDPPKRHRSSPLRKSSPGDWRRMSLQAMLVGETVGEIVQASKFAKANPIEDPRTPDVKISSESTPIEKSRRKREKIEKKPQLMEDKDSPNRRTRPRIIFKPSPPKKFGSKEDEVERRETRYSARKVAKNPVLFPNKLFVTADSTHQQKFYKTRSPVIARAKTQTPNKFLIKSPRQVSKFPVKVKSPTKIACLSPPSKKGLGKKVDSLIVSSKTSATMAPPFKNLGRNRDGLLKISATIISPSKNFGRDGDRLEKIGSKDLGRNGDGSMKRMQSPNVVSKLRRSLSPARIAARFLSPLRNVQRNGNRFSKQRHIVATPKTFEHGNHLFG